MPGTGPWLKLTLSKQELFSLRAATGKWEARSTALEEDLERMQGLLETERAESQRCLGEERKAREASEHHAATISAALAEALLEITQLKEAAAKAEVLHP